MGQLYMRGATWYASVRVGGKRIQRSTACTDEVAARKVLAQWERDAADPEATRLRDVTLTMALELLIKSDLELIGQGKCAPDTLDFHRAKAGQLVRVFERDAAGHPVTFRLASLDAPHVDAYISRRRGEGTMDATIKKELVVLRKSLRFAIRAKLWRGRVEEVMPVDFSPDYKPRLRKLSSAELQALLGQLQPDRAARVAFMVATSANWRETERALRADLPEGCTTVEIRGTKTSSRHRWVPLVTPAQRSLIPFVQAHAGGKGGPLFTTWNNARRDINAAARRAGLAPCSPNDFRRTFADWMVEAGVPLHIVAAMMGHKDTRMLERVYGRQTPEQLAAAVARAPGFAEAACNAGVTAQAVPAALRGPGGGSSSKGAKKPRATAAPENKRPRETLRSGGAEMSDGMCVPGGGIEPPTRGFSVPPSRPSRPRLHVVSPKARRSG